MENDEAVDLVVDCVDCKDEFVLTAEELDWFADNDLERPKRCEACRKERKAARQQQQTRVAGQAPSEYRNSGPRRRDESVGNTWLLDDRPHYKIACKTCREDAFVPFIPRGPAQCQRCHSEQRQRLENSTRY